MQLLFSTAWYVRTLSDASALSKPQSTSRSKHFLYIPLATFLCFIFHLFSLVVCLFCFRVLSSWKQIMSFPLFFSSENKLMHAPFKTQKFSQMIDYLRVIQFKIPSIVCVCVCGYVYIRWPKINLIINYTI